MTTFAFRCDACGRNIDQPVRQPDRPSPCCGAPLRRVWGAVAFHRSMQPHWNPTLGRYVSTMREFEDGLKRANDRNFERVGWEGNLVPIDTSDPTACGVTAEGLDETHRRQRDSGQTEPTKRIIAL